MSHASQRQGIAKDFGFDGRQRALQLLDMLQQAVTGAREAMALRTPVKQLRPNVFFESR